MKNNEIDSAFPDPCFMCVSKAGVDVISEHSLPYPMSHVF